MSIESRLRACEEGSEEHTALLRLLADTSLAEAPELGGRVTCVECLDDGFVRLVDYMGTDAAIAQAARVSYGNHEKSKTASDDRQLIRRLMRDGHTSPFEMCELKFHVRVPMDCWRQWIRHRTANVNEYSTRYSVAIDSAQRTEPDEWRMQSKTNKQGSELGVLLAWPADYEVEPRVSGVMRVTTDVTRPTGQVTSIDTVTLPTPGDYLTAKELHAQETLRDVYEERLHFGVAREQARKDLPLSTYTEAYWKIDLHNLFHFLRLRLDPHAQKEIREYGVAMAKLVEPLFPVAYEAFLDYQVNSMRLSALEIEAIQTGDDSHITNATERAAYLAKRGRLCL